MAEINKADCLEFLQTIHQPDAVFEIRILGGQARGTVSGYFNNAELAVEHIGQADRELQPAGIYTTINPIQPGLLARSVNHLTVRAKHTTTDAQVTGRRWLYVDIDVGEAGVSATDSEVHDAIELAEQIDKDRQADNWRPAELIGMTGNGACIYWPVDLPVDSDLPQLVLMALKDRYGDGPARVDLTTHNPSRIAKVLGTVARKGDDMRGVSGLEDRPHRTSRIIRGR